LRAVGEESSEPDGLQNTYHSFLSSLILASEEDDDEQEELLLRLPQALGFGFIEQK